MQPLKFLGLWLSKNANNQHYLFLSRDLRSLFPKLTDNAFKTLLSRAASSQLLIRVCRGLYLYKDGMLHDGLLLFHAAALLRASEFNYISLDTALSDTGIISQVPTNSITIMSSGRSNTVSCGSFGTIEFVHTNQKPEKLLKQLTYDEHCGMWRASISLALRDMKTTRRNSDLINWDLANELI